MVALGRGGVSYERGIPVQPDFVSGDFLGQSPLCGMVLVDPLSSEYGTYKTVSQGQTNMAHIRQSRQDYGLGFQVKVLKTI